MVVQNIIPSYLYSQYADDDDLQAFVRAYKQIAQAYLNTFIQIGLPIYPNQAGGLLDWVCVGLYGYSRPVLPSGLSRASGPYNTVVHNTLAYNGNVKARPNSFFVASDNVYVRCLTWNFYKGDGKQFTIPWLKRRIARFLFGPGQNTSEEPFAGFGFDVAHLYQISMTFGADYQVNINFPTHFRKITSGALYNRFAYNKIPYNSFKSTGSSGGAVPTLAPILKAAIASGALELPIQYSWVVNIGS